MRIAIPKFDSKKELFAYLKENKQEIIKQKKSMPIYAEPMNIGVAKIRNKSEINTKDAHIEEEVIVDNGKIRVKVVANTSNWIDSHSDMLLADCWSKSINERKGVIPHLHDHIHTIDAKVGEVVDIYSSNVSFSELGLQGIGSTQALIFITDVMKSYNEKVYNQYKAGKINQHSIGLQYVKLDLALNDEESEKEFDFWNKYIGKAINREKAEEQGYFWVVQEIKLLENSAVLFGSNELTPTLDNNVKSHDTLQTMPEESTLEEEPVEKSEVTFLHNYLS